MIAPYSAAFVFGIITLEEKIELLNEENAFVNKLLGVVSYISKASFHIFLTQQLYFCFDNYIRSKMNILEASILDIVICIVMGCLFYCLHKKCEVVYHRGRSLKFHMNL